MEQNNNSFPDFSGGMSVGNTDMEEIKNGIKEITEELKKINKGIDDIKANYTTVSKTENDNPNDTIEIPEQNDNTNEEVQVNESEKNNLTEEIDIPGQNDSSNVIEFPKIPVVPTQEDIPVVPAQENIPTLVPQEGESKEFTNTTEPTEMEKEKSDVSIEIPNDAIDNPTLPTLGSEANNIGQQPTIPVLNEEQNVEAAEEFKPDVNIGVPTQDTTEVQNASVEQPQNTVAEQVTEEIKQNDNAEVQQAPIENAMPVQEETIPQNTGEEQSKQTDNIIDITSILNNAQNNAQVATPVAAPVDNAVQVPTTNADQNNAAEQQMPGQVLNETQNTATDRQMPGQVSNETQNNAAEQQTPGQGSNETQNNNKDNINILYLTLDKGANAPENQQRNLIIPLENHENIKSFRTNNQIDNNAQVMTLKQAA